MDASQNPQTVGQATELRTGLALWEFAEPGPLRERLCGLALAGVKTGTFDIADEEYAAEPKHNRHVMIDSTGREIAIVEVIARTYVRAGDVTWEQVQTEGESFTSVADWRQGHENFWGSIGYFITDDSLLAYERFRIAEILPGALLARYPIVELIVDRTDVEEASSDLYDLDHLLGIEEADVRVSTAGHAVSDSQVVLRVGFASDQSAAAAELAIDRRWHPRFEVLLGDEWLDTWRETFEPFRVGRFVVVPAWWPGDAANAHEVVRSLTPDDLLITLDPERAWGTGAHESTQIMLEMLQDIEGQSQGAVLDVGCGSGILSVAAAMHGWSSVHGIDVEPVAVEVTLRNAERNSASGISASCETLRTFADQSFSIVMANILAPVLVELAPELMRVRAPGSPVLLAGLIDTQVDLVVSAFHPLCRYVMESNGVWRGLILND